MENSRYSSGPLGNLRVLELSDVIGEWCGKLMGDLGADIVKVEPPGGVGERRIGPFYQDVPHPERSLHFWHYNTSKRSITLNPGDRGWPRSAPQPGGVGGRSA